MRSLTLESASEKTPGAVSSALGRASRKSVQRRFDRLDFYPPRNLRAVARAPRSKQAGAHGNDEAAARNGRAHVLGTDNLGRDILSRIVYGARVSLLVAFAVVFVSGLIGVILGAISGYIGGKADFLIQKLVEVVWAFPPLLLGITIMAFFGQGLTNLIFALVAQRWIPYCRVVRGQALSLRERDFVMAARCLGATQKPDYRASYSSQSDSNLAGHRHLCNGVFDHRRSELEFPRCRRAAGNSNLGHHARRRAYLHQHRLVDAAISRSMYFHNGSRHQPARRCPARLLDPRLKRTGSGL